MVEYVDDLLISSEVESVSEDVKKELSGSFVVKDLGRASNYVGVAINYDDKAGTLQWRQSPGITKYLKKFNMESCKPI